jgi:hypothetical protein
VFDEVLPALRRCGRYEIGGDGRFQKKTKRLAVPEADLQELLSLISDNLLHGDKKSVAAEIDVCENEVVRVLQGKAHSSKILKALFDRALYNHRHKLSVYSKAFVRDGIAALQAKINF